MSFTAGKHLDEAVAEKVLGWEHSADGWRDPATGEAATLRGFSTDVAAAWEMAERVCDSGFRLHIDGSRIWQARFYKSAAHTLETRAYAATGRTPAEAICLAALTARGVDLGGGKK